MTQENSEKNTDKDLGSSNPRSIEEVRKAFSKILGTSEDQLPFEFYERTGELVAHQNGYIPDYKKWFRIHDYTLEKGGRAEQSEEDHSYYFTFPKASGRPETAAIGFKEAPKQKPGPGTDAGKPSGETVKQGYYAKFPVDRILSNPFGFRVNIEEGIDELMAEIHAAGMIIEPLVGRPKRGGYVEVGPGERRLYAAKQMRMKTVPIIVKEFTDAEFDRIRFLENLARKDLTDMEIARILDHLLKEYPEKYPTQQDLANAFGKSQQWVSYHLQMLKLEEFTTRVVKWTEILSKITEFQARGILSAPTEKRVEVAEWIVKKYEETGGVPSAQEIHEFVRGLVGPKPVEVPVEEEPEVPAEEEEKPSIPCDRCGKSVTVPVHIRGKFYCEECAREVLDRKPAKPSLSKSVVLEALEKVLFPIFPEGVETEKIREDLQEDYDTSNLSDLLVELMNEDIIALHNGRWMTKEEYDEKQTALEELRFKIRDAEQVLMDNYDFDPKRGLETYKISEIKFLAQKNGPTEEFLRDLKKCVDFLKDYFKVYYDLDEFRSIEDDSATQNIERISRYLQRAKPIKPVDLSGTGGRHCPLCGRPLTRRAYETLKRKFGSTVKPVKELFKK